MIYELRIYYVVPGRMEELLNRFRDHTLHLFQKHDLKVANFWVDMDASNDRLYYVFEHRDLAAREKNFQAFLEDPDWLALQERTERNGKLYERIDEIYMRTAPLRGFQPNAAMARAQ
ncbi:NIPSNAP family protein [Paenibacillus rhizovicinus]|uniref:NIPSNAP family protein n=1 Tax=Paenibacillus rhizovicinus TaxID=2704463 RepID=A0A6C0PBV1_9BACL|nr:NIPSNAP family protein [Paenibacillus rhizovicinus]QHW34122.1 NIPSNAP family protein [Paenibacillus rhizovicinus]